MTARDDVREFWDAELQRWCLGDRRLSPSLTPWLRSYAGTGPGAVDLGAFPEPWIGPLAGAPRLVMLGLNPGAASHPFQGDEGVFTRRIAETSYSGWAASAPYTSAAWEAVHGRNKYHRDRLAFAQRFLQDTSIAAEDLLLMELFPFHSNRVTAPMRPPRSVLDPFVFAPLAEIDTEHVFAFGKPWLAALSAVGLQPLTPVAARWSTPSRSAVPFRLPSGQQVIVLTQSGYAGPPGAGDTEALIHALRT